MIWGALATGVICGSGGRVVVALLRVGFLRGLGAAGLSRLCRFRVLGFWPGVAARGSRPAGGYFLLSCQEKVTKEKALEPHLAQAYGYRPEGAYAALDA